MKCNKEGRGGWTQRTRVGKHQVRSLGPHNTELRTRGRSPLLKKEREPRRKIKQTLTAKSHANKQCFRGSRERFVSPQPQGIVDNSRETAARLPRTSRIGGRRVGDVTDARKALGQRVALVKDSRALFRRASPYAVVKNFVKTSGNPGTKGRYLEGVHASLRSGIGRDQVGKSTRRKCGMPAVVSPHAAPWLSGAGTKRTNQAGRHVAHRSARNDRTTKNGVNHPSLRVRNGKKLEGKDPKVLGEAIRRAVMRKNRPIGYRTRRVKRVKRWRKDATLTRKSEPGAGS